MTVGRQFLLSSGKSEWPAGSRAAALQPLRVLVVDDDKDTVFSLFMLLQDEGYQVHGVHSGRYVMGAVIDFDPDVVILDISLPGLSGWEVARTIRDRRGRGRPKIIGISGEYRQGADRALSEILGFDDYFVKPYSPDDLLKAIASRA